MTQTCSKCGLEKDAGLFPASGRQCDRCIADRAAEWRKARPDRVLIWRAVRDAIRDGVIVRAGACEECGVECDTQGHHEDYAKPLEVKWLCFSCHQGKHSVRPKGKKRGPRRPTPEGSTR